MKIETFDKDYPEECKARDLRRDLWLVWQSRIDNLIGRPVADLRAIEETEAGAEFVKAILKRDEPHLQVHIESRVSHHIYAWRDMALAMRFSRIGKDEDED